MAIEFTASAGRHGFTLDDALHAMSHHRFHLRRFDRSRVDGVAPDLWIGPSRHPAAPLIEVMAEVIEPDTVRIFHVMAARRKFLDRLDPPADDQEES